MICWPNGRQTNPSTTSAFNLRLELVYHDYQSHFRIQARFDRRSEDVDHIRGEFHRIYLKLPRDAFHDIWNQSLLEDVSELSTLPQQASNDLVVQKAHKKGFLRILNLEVSYMQLVSLHSPFVAKTSEAETTLQKLREIDGKKSKITLLLEAGPKAVFAMNDLKKRLFDESAPLAEYYHQTGGYG
jgi:hypothetical protein